MAGGVLERLRFIVFLTSVLAVVHKVGGTGVSPRGGQPRILIVGAGVSGLAAATRLLDNGLTNLVLLEAEGRIGGRVHSVKLGEWTVDYGAHWIHNGPGNPVYELAEPLGLVAESGDFQALLEFFSDGTSMGPADWSGASSHPMDLLQDIEGEMAGLSNVSFQTFLTPRVQPLLARVLDQDKSTAYEDYLMKLLCVTEGCESLQDVSARHYSDYLELNSSRTLGWKGKGYGSIIDLLLRRHEKSKGPPIELGEKLHLNTEVNKIEVLDDVVQVHTANGTVYSADIVLVTVSVGVLKNRLETLFNPPLPQPKKDAINAIGLGTVDKIILRFPNIWWPTNISGFEIVWLSKDKASYQGEFNWEKEVLAFALEAWSPYTLTAWLIGDAAREMERTPLAGVQKGCMRVLRRFLGSTYNISEPVEVIRSSWGTNPHFLGSWSYRRMEAERYNVSHISTPLLRKDGRQVVFFGGEATHSYFFSTVHGALESGWREADRIINLLH